MQKRFRGLRIIGFILKIVGSFELFVGLTSLILLPLALSNTDSALTLFADSTLKLLGLQLPTPGPGLVIGIVSGLLVFLIGLVTGLLTFSTGELFRVLIAIEENTRASVILQQAQKQ
jgi:hypothetical protein